MARKSRGFLLSTMITKGADTITKLGDFPCFVALKYYQCNIS